jgi:diguanylate cyclase (GGDEF)-like protein
MDLELQLPLEGTWISAELARDLVTGESGLVTIREWLRRRRETWDVRDIVVVAEGEQLGRQVFRAEDGPLGTGWAAHVARHAPVGVYTDPAVPLQDSERITAARLCYLALQLDVISHRSSTDPLTGLHNRGAFEAALRRAVENAARYGWSTTLVILDLDEFKPVNDRFGHLVGDQVLRAVATELSRVLRSGDIAARIGGDEFALLLAAIVDDELRLLMSRLADAVTRSSPHPITFSWGSAATPDRTTDPTDLFQAADAALYAAKSRP